MRQWLIRIRKEKVLTQSSIARRAGISRSYYTQIELSQRSPSIRVAKLIADCMGFEWTIFYDDIPGLGECFSGLSESAP
jgi:putative transcriptional regulator